MIYIVFYRAFYIRECVLNLCAASSKSCDNLQKFTSSIDTRNIHGDFNSRNILINKKNEVVIIDFSEMDQGHIVKDIAKLERDIIFRVFEAGTPSYYDWGKSRNLKHFMKLNKKGYIFSTKYINSGINKNIKKSIKFIRGIRKTLKDLSPELTEKEYLCALLHYSLLGIIHSEVSIHRKVFGIQYVNDILENF